MSYPIPNTFGIDARCSQFVEYSTQEQLKSLLPSLRSTRWFHIGAGSNLLFTADFNGTILHSALRGIEEVRRTQSEVLLRVGAGEVWDEFVEFAVCHGYYGAENLSAIPGEVGASAVQNIGAYGVEVGQLIREVEAVEVATGEVRVFQVEECEYAYRSSVFKHALKGQYIVTHVTYALQLTFSPDLEYGAIRRELEVRGLAPDALTASDLRTLICEVRHAKLPDPAEMGSAGSFFMNPVVSEEMACALLADYPEMPHYQQASGVKVPAGWLIEKCGWKGKSLGRAGVYPKQALVLVNLGGATGSDIVALSDAICKDVKAKFGITIKPEVNFIQ